MSEVDDGQADRFIDPLSASFCPRDTKPGLLRLIFKRIIFFEDIFPVPEGVASAGILVRQFGIVEYAWLDR